MLMQHIADPIWRLFAAMLCIQASKLQEIIFEK